MTTKSEIYKELQRRNKASQFFLQSPADSSKRFVEYVDWTNQSEKLDYGCILDQHLTPPLPGDYISIMARPGHKKTAFMSALAKRYARQISERGKQDEEVIVYATWDEAVENIENYLHAGLGSFDASDVAWGRVTKDQAIEASIQRVSQMTPLWVWGVSIMDNDKSKPPFTIDWLFDTVRALRHEYGMTVKALFLDYIQNIPVPDEATRTAQVTRASSGARFLAKDVGCPVFAGVQASRQADTRTGQLPIWSDAQHASAIEQDSGKQIALSNPIKFEEPGEIIDVAGKFYTVTDALTIVRILKQRGERGAGTFAIDLDPATFEIVGDSQALEPVTTRLAEDELSYPV